MLLFKVSLNKFYIVKRNCHGFPQKALSAKETTSLEAFKRLQWTELDIERSKHESTGN